MKKYKFLRPLYLEGHDYAIGDEPYIQKVGERTYWLTLNNVDTYITEKQYNELLSKNIIELL